MELPHKAFCLALDLKATELNIQKLCIAICKCWLNHNKVTLAHGYAQQQQLTSAHCDQCE
eukprot:scaffold25987_cov30-Cyclotella_meneghiniana.AAC.1